MVFEGSVEAFNELLVGSVGLGLTVEVLEPDHGAVLKRWVLGSLGVEEVDARGIGGISIGHKDNGLMGVCGANGLCHCNNGGEGISCVCHMVGGDLEALGRDEEEDIVMFSEDLDVGLIPCAEVINRSLTGEVKAMAREGGSGGIVEDRLVGKMDTEYGSEDGSGLPGT
jgi:hypothetical protein